MKSQSVFIILIILLINCTQEEKPENPTINITALSPETGTEGTVVEISGLGFSTIEEENLVTFNGADAQVIDASETTLIVSVPVGATTGRVTVTKDGETAEGSVFTVIIPTVTKAFFVKFKANGITNVFEEANPGYQSCGQCACSYVPVLNDARSASVVICNDSPNWITAADIEGWDGDNIPIHTMSFPTAALEFTVDDIFYSSDNVSSQAASEVNITSVVADGTFNTKQAFKVSGNFKCNVSQSDGTHLMSITEGSFVLRYTED